MTDNRRDEPRRKPAGAWQADLAHLLANTGAKYSYELKPRPPELGGGWHLRLLEDGNEVGGGVFPVPPADPLQGIAWWNGISEKERGRWMLVAGSAVPADAWQAWREASAYADAEAEASGWVDARASESKTMERKP